MSSPGRESSRPESRAPGAPRPPATPPFEGPRFRSETALGAGVIVLFLGVFGLWSALAPLESAAVAGGKVVVRDSRKTVQHLEGGLIRDLLVREGDRVDAGDVLVRLDDTRSHATRELLQHRHDALLAEWTRLGAEREGAPSVQFPTSLDDRRAEPRVAELLAGQERIFGKRRHAVRGRKGILRQRIAQLQAEVTSHEAQMDGSGGQLDALREEMTSIRTLVEKGYEARSRLLEMEREAAALEGDRLSAEALAARARREIHEARMAIAQIDSDQLEQVVAQQQRVRERLAETEESLRAATDIQARSEIRAPIAGTVVNLHFFTAGGVIGAGDPILDIVPSGGDLLIEARVRPTDIEVVREGMRAAVRLIAFKQRLIPPLGGKVEHVSADALVDEATGVAYYEAWIAIPETELRALGGLELQPGMPAEVLIVTGERTLLRYAVQPFTDSFFRALRED